MFHFRNDVTIKLIVSFIVIGAFFHFPVNAAPQSFSESKVQARQNIYLIVINHNEERCIAAVSGDGQVKQEAGLILIPADTSRVKMLTVQRVLSGHTSFQPG